jgi:formylglycine-generating enzyme required for sulfatase activity
MTRGINFFILLGLGGGAFLSAACIPQPVGVPDVVGMTEADAEAAILAAGLAVGTVTEAYSATAPACNVISQDPLAGASVLPRSAVDLVVSLGPEAAGTAIGPEGGTSSSEEGAEVEVPAGGLNEDLLFQVEEPTDAELRAAIPDDRPYAGAVTINATQLNPGKAGDPVNEGFHMTVTVPVDPPFARGTEFDVYLKGEDYGEWTRLGVTATVAEDGTVAIFEASEPGTYLVREPDEYSTLTIDLGDTSKAADDYVPEVGYGLHKIAGTGPIPIVLIHGAGSNLHTQPGVEDCGFEDCGQYARWDEFVTWAVAGGLDLDNTYQLWWFLHDPLDAIGFPQDLASPALENNAWQLAQELEAKRALQSNAFPDETHQFIIIAHSRGGLVTRAFMENWPTGGDQVLAAVTLATPHHGSCLAVPDWVFDTVERHYWGDVAETIMILAWEKRFQWDEPGDADLAWDNFDGTTPYEYGVPYRHFVIYAWLFGLVTVGATVSTNDAGWPTDTGVTDPTIWLPSQYLLADDTTPGRRSGTTLWDLNHRAQADEYLDKFILYGGYLHERGGWADAVAGVRGNDHRGLAYLNRVMSNFESAGQTVSHYAANDGLVALQSALYLDADSDEPIYATEDPWFARIRVKYPIDLDDPAIQARLKLHNASHAVIMDDYDHLEMVSGKDGGTVLFENIEQRLDWTVAARPTALFVVEPAKAGGSVTVDASGSHDNAPSGYWPATSLDYRADWDASDGLNWSDWSGSSTMNHSYGVAGTYTVSLQVRDQDGMMSDVVDEDITVQPGGEGEGEGEPGETETIMLPGDVPLTMVWIPAGTFMMGRYPGEQDSYSDEDPQHQVTLTHGFWLGKYELTKRQWTAVMGTTPWSGQDYVLDDPDSPAVYMSWDDAQVFMTALNTYTGQTFRLPSEAEWEYACRAGTTTRFYWGDDASYADIGNYAWYEGNAWNAGEQYAHVVGLKLPNAWGLYDMSGNVWEWCQDWYGGYPSGAVIDPQGASTSTYRVLRGGGWTGNGRYCRSALRYWSYPGARGSSMGSGSVDRRPRASE